MKKIILPLFICLFIVACGCFIYFNQSVTEYYIVSEYPSTAYGSKKEVKIQKVKQYESDSLAIEEEETKYHFMQEDWNRRVEEAKKKNSPSDIMIYTRFRDEQRCLIKIAHKRLFDYDKFKELVIQYGPNSTQLETFCENNNVVFSMFPMLSDY